MTLKISHTSHRTFRGHIILDTVKLLFLETLAQSVRAAQAQCILGNRQERGQIKRYTLGNRLMVGQRPLKPLIGVRLPVPQLVKKKLPLWELFLLQAGGKYGMGYRTSGSRRPSEVFLEVLNRNILKVY